MQAFFGAEYDYPSYVHAPPLQLMVATIPRSGSTAFCNDLWNTGVLGAPMEYLNLRWVGRHDRWVREIEDLQRYWRKLQSVRTSPSGVFSYKLFMPNYFDVLKRCPALLPSLAPTHVVFLTRKDVVAQAVSYAKAIHSRQWFGNEGRDVRLEYNKASIDNARELILKQREQWERVFTITDATVLRVSYEEYLSVRTETVQKVVRYVCGAARRAGNLGLRNIRVQRDISNYQWMERYKRERNMNDTSAVEGSESI